MEDEIVTVGFIDKVEAPVVYHYTTLDCFESILSSKSFWLSHISVLNDLGELEYGANFICDKLSKYNGIDKRLISYARDIIVAYKKFNICIGSFCSEKDLLSQWRTYGNEGCGVAIGFNVGLLSDLCGKNDFYLGPCYYEEGEQLRKLVGVGKELIEKENKLSSDAILIILTLLAGFLKKDCFKEEREVRVFTHPKVNLKTRIVQKRIVPYYELDLLENFDSLIKEVIVGACANPSATYKAIEVMLKQAGISKIFITESRIPYRTI